ncbi:MAG: helix-turn-helix transcriptional regulator [Gammaproteobacteria bacterium]|nr:helix-turn-helix transcriptional regulator [Gammaproteobacteria bacterium]
METDEPRRAKTEADAEAGPQSESERDAAEETPPPPSVGATLAAARQRMGLSVFDVSGKLRLTEHYVRAIEADDYNKLPSEVFVKGYLKSYAEFVGLDPEQVRGAYRRPPGPAETVHAPPVRQKKAMFSRTWFLALLLAICAASAGAAGWWAWQTFGAAFFFSPINTRGKPADES